MLMVLAIEVQFIACVVDCNGSEHKDGRLKIPDLPL